MPSKSEAQHRLMEGVAHSKSFAEKVGIPQSVGEEFSHADEAKHHEALAEHHKRMSEHHSKKAQYHKDCM